MSLARQSTRTTQSNEKEAILVQSVFCASKAIAVMLRKDINAKKDCLGLFDMSYLSNTLGINAWALSGYIIWIITSGPWAFSLISELNLDLWIDSDVVCSSDVVCYLV